MAINKSRFIGKNQVDHYVDNDENKNKKKEEKHVRFNNIVNMSIIIMNNNYYHHDKNNNNSNNNGNGEQQQQEKQKVSDMFWYSQKDLEDFRKQNNDIAAGMAFGDIIEGDEHTYRGLELHDSRKCKKYRNTCYKAHRAVFLEQEKQLRKGVVDPNIIADVYKKNGAKGCQKKAYRMGLLDYNDAYNRRCCDANLLDNTNNNNNNTKPKKNLILKTSKRKMKEIMLCFTKSQNHIENNKNKNKNDDDKDVIQNKHDDHEETSICDETITNDHPIDEIGLNV